MVLNGVGLESWFISSLVNAGNCHHGAPKALPSSTFFSSRRPQAWKKLSQSQNQPIRRHIHKLAKLPTHNVGTFEEERRQEEWPCLDNEPTQEPTRSKEELLRLVDQYSGGYYSYQTPLIDLPPRYQPSDGPHLTVSDKPKDEWPPPDKPEQCWPADSETKSKIEELEFALKNPYRDPEEMYELYKALPSPRITYLEARTRHRMMNRLAVVERRDEHSMLRYLSVVDDMKRAAIPLSVTEWTSALSFVTRYVRQPTHVEVEDSLEMWKEMERSAGVKSSNATFNTLFNVACRAGKLNLAEMIYTEMENRGLEADRFKHVSLIFYYGLRGNGDGARAAYKEMVEAGEVIDTVTLNAMISALIRSGEPSAADNIYERMKEAHINNANGKLNPRDFRARRSMTKTLINMTKLFRDDKEKMEALQKRSIISPDLATFLILVSYYATKAGELDKTAKLLEEMKWFALPLHGYMFFSLFKGFALHGGIRYTHWTEARLEKVWTSFMGALVANEKEVYMSKWMAAWILQGFAVCAGKERVWTVWAELKAKWEPDEVELDFVNSRLRIIMDNDLAGHKRDWILGAVD